MSDVEIECAGVPCPCILLALCACHRRYNLYFTSFFPERYYKYIIFIQHLSEHFAYFYLTQDCLYSANWSRDLTLAARD